MRVFLALASPVLLCLAGCSSTEAGYDEALRGARTDCARNEVVGVWTLRQPSMDRSGVILFKPDGTGRDRTKLGADSVEERAFTWSYKGSGVWTGEETGAAIATPGESPSKRSRSGWHISYTLRLTSQYLLCEFKPEERREQKSHIVSSMLLGPLVGPIASSVVSSHGTTVREVFVRAN